MFLHLLFVICLSLIILYCGLTAMSSVFLFFSAFFYFILYFFAFLP
nr:MAG TPA: hypothetical protein [Caudoviricetes sp.]